MSPKQRDHTRDGISIEDRWQARGSRTGKRWLAKVRDTRLQRYKRKAFSDLDAAKAWARQTRARFELAESSAGTWPLENLLEDYEAAMIRERRPEKYISTVIRHGRMLQSIGVRDLADDGLHAKMRVFLDLPLDSSNPRNKRTEAAPNTKRQRFKWVRALVSFAMQNQGLRTNPLSGFSLPWQKRHGAISRPSDQETYTIDEVRSVLALNLPSDPYWLVFLVAIYTGLRAFELHALRWEDVDWVARIVRVARGKGSKVRHVPMQPELYDYLSKLGGPEAESPRIGRMFVIENSRIDIRWLRILLERASVTWDRGMNSITGLPRRLTWHACRRTCAAASLAAGVDSLEIQRSLGHEEMEMTGEYAGAFARWKAVIQAEGWPRGRLCLLTPPASENVAGG